MPVLGALALLAGICLPPQTAATPTAAVQPAPRELNWEEFVRREFRTGLLLPGPEAAELGSGSRAVPDITAEMRRLAGQTFADRGEEPGTEWAASFGNLMQEFEAIRRDQHATNRLLAQFKREHRAAYDQVAAYLPELVRSDLLYGRRWKPGQATERDGMLDLPAWEVLPRLGRSSFWRKLDADRKVYQTAVFVYADYATIKAVENDYARYEQHVGRDLEWIHPVRGSHVVAPVDGEPRFVAVTVRFEAQAPFLFPNVLGEMHILERRGPGGFLTTELYTDPGGFHWFAGRDTYFPVYTTTGGFVGTLVANQTGMDVAGVPDGGSDRRKAVRSSLGNKKRLAEPRFDAIEDWKETPASVVPVIPVTGWR